MKQTAKTIMKTKYYLLRMIAIVIIVGFNSCRTKKPYWETSTKIELRNTGHIWMSIDINGIPYPTFVDTGVECSFPSNFLKDYFSDTTQFTTSGKAVSIQHWKPYAVQKVPPILFRLGNREFNHVFKRDLRSDTCIKIGIDLIKKNSWNFNLKDSILKVSNQKLNEKDINGSNLFHSSISYRFVDKKATARLPISLGEGKKVFRQRFIFDTGCAIVHVEGDKKHLMDVAIVVNNLERYYNSYPTFFSSLKKHVTPLEKTHPYRTDLFCLDSVVFNGAKYTDFRVAIVEIPEAHDISEYIVLLGMGFYSRFSNLYIDKKQVILYNEE